MTVTQFSLEGSEMAKSKVAIGAVTVETAQGSFTGKNMREAVKLAAAAKEKEDEREQRVVRIERAIERAHAMAFRILRASLDATECGSKIGPFDYYPIGHESAKSLITVDADRPLEATLHMQECDIVTRFGHEVVGVVMTGNGQPGALVVRNAIVTEQFFVLALGQCGEHIQTVVVPVVKVDQFSKPPF